MSDETPRPGAALLAMLPRVYRDRDETGDFAAYLDAFAVLLEQIRALVDQRLLDATLDEGAQGWVLPYHADLFDVQLHSPDLEGRRSEVSHGIDWRQRKATLDAVREIADAVGGSVHAVHEGLARVATTARVDLPLPSQRTSGAVGGEASPPADPRVRSGVVRRAHGLGTVTVDFRREAGTVRTATRGINSQLAAFEPPVWWQRSHVGGLPPVLRGYQDLSLRTVDVRAPTWERGHAHPKRLVLHAPVSEGFYPRDASVVKAAELFEWIATYVPGASEVEPPSPELELSFADGTLRLAGPAGGLVVDDDASLTLAAADLPAGVERVQIERLALRGALDVSVPLVLRQVAARSVNASASLDAKDALVEKLSVRDQGVCRLEYVTVLGSLDCGHLDASDSILVARPTAARARIRYCCIPEPDPEDPPPDEWWVYERSMSRHRPTFFERELGRPSCGVLHPGCEAAIRFGAEDGGELGAYHHRRYAARPRAVEDKLRDFVPVGMSVVVVPDACMHALAHSNDKAKTP